MIRGNELLMVFFKAEYRREFYVLMPENEL